jgi:short subunit fatty acids transporter
LKALFKILAFIVIMPLLLLAAVIYFILQPNENEILRCAALAQDDKKNEQLTTNHQV